MLFKASFAGGGASSAVEVSVDTTDFENSEAENLQILAEDSDRKITLAANPGHVTTTGVTPTSLDSLLSGLGTIGSFTGNLDGPTLMVTPPAGQAGRAQWSHPEKFPIGLGAGVDGLYGARLTFLGDTADVSAFVFAIVNTDTDELVDGFIINPQDEDGNKFIEYDSGALLGQSEKAIVYNESPIFSSTYTLELNTPIILDIDSPGDLAIVVAVIADVEIPFHLEWLYGSWVGIRQLLVNKIGDKLEIGTDGKLTIKSARTLPSATAGYHDGQAGGVSDALGTVPGWRSDVREIIADAPTGPDGYTWVQDRVAAMMNQETDANNGFWEILAVGSGHGDAPTSAEVGGTPDGTLVAVRCTQLNNWWSDEDIFGGTPVILGDGSILITEGDGLDCNFSQLPYSATETSEPAIAFEEITDGECYEDIFDTYEKVAYQISGNTLTVPATDNDEKSYYAAVYHEHSVESGVLYGFKIQFAEVDLDDYFANAGSYVAIESMTTDATPVWKREYGYAIDSDSIWESVDGYGSGESQSGGYHYVYACGGIKDYATMWVMFGEPKDFDWAGRLVFQTHTLAWGGGSTPSSKSATISSITPVYGGAYRAGSDPESSLNGYNFLMPYSSEIILWDDTTGDKSIEFFETDGRTNSNFVKPGKTFTGKILVSDTGGGGVYANGLDSNFVLSTPGDFVRVQYSAEHGWITC